LKILKQEQMTNERSDDYNNRILEQTKRILKIEEESK